RYATHRVLHSFPTRRSSDLGGRIGGMHTTRLEYQIMLIISQIESPWLKTAGPALASIGRAEPVLPGEALDRLRESPYDLVLIERSEEHTSELQSRENLVCRL